MPNTHVLTQGVELRPDLTDRTTQRVVSELGAAARLLIAKTAAEERAAFSFNPRIKDVDFPVASDAPPAFLAERVGDDEWYVMAYLAKPHSSLVNPRMDYGLFSVRQAEAPDAVTLDDLRRDYYASVNSQGHHRQLSVTETVPKPVKVLGGLTLAVRALDKNFRKHRQRHYWEIT